MAKQHYVNNADFCELISNHRKACQEAISKGNPQPRIPEEAGRIIMMIAERYARRPNFSGYMYKDEMIQNGIESAIRAFNNFDPEKSRNPLAYFTQCIHFAFIGTISKEKKLLYTKIRAIREGELEFMEILEHDDGIDSSQRDYLMEFLDKNEHEIEFGFLNKKPEPEKQKQKKIIESPLDQFFGEE